MHQKLAEVIVRIGLEQFGKIELRRENSDVHLVFHDEPGKHHILLKEVVNLVGE